MELDEEAAYVCYLLRRERVRGCPPLCTILTLSQAFHLAHVKSMPDLLCRFKISQTAAQSHSTVVVWK